VRTIHLQITGKVQGVFYRAAARKVARRLALSGWIKNSGDIMVEAIISGDDEQLEAFVAWSKRGPEKARVQEVKILELEPQHFNSFEILR
jgi:acylphosphatase